MVLKALVVWLLIAVAEVLHGILRVRLLNRRVGDRRARQIGVFTGSLVIVAMAWIFIPWIGASTPADLFGMGLLWLVLMLAFDLGFGRLIFRFSWQRVAADFDPRRGGLLALGMLVLFLAPYLVAKLRGLL